MVYLLLLLLAQLSDILLNTASITIDNPFLTDSGHALVHKYFQCSLPAACSGLWDNITCWRPAEVGETVTVPCPKVFSNFYSKPGTVSASMLLS